MMMMVMYRRRRGEAGKPSFKFSSVDYLAWERKQLTDPPPLAGAVSKFLFTDLAGKIEPELDIGALLRPNFFPPLRQQSSPTLNLMNAKLFPPSGLPWEQSGNCLLRLSEVHNCLLQKTSDSVKKKRGETHFGNIAQENHDRQTMASFWIKVACLRAPPFIFPNVSREIPIMSFTAERKAAIENNQEVGMRRALAQLQKRTDDQTAHERERGGKVQ